MATLPLANYAAQVTATGISAPSFADILESLKLKFQEIYGEDAYLEADSQDGQLLAAFASALHDCNQAAVSVFNNFSPATAYGAGLSSVVKINHLQRLVATASQVNVTIVGQAGVTITNGVVEDQDGQKWLLPPLVVIPPGGSVLVTATAEEVGAVQAPADSVTRIVTPVAGWQSVNNDNPATPGQPVESDAALRTRQEISPAMNSYTVLQGLAAALKDLTGVTYGVIYENDTDTTDGNGVPGHSIAVVIAGGDTTEIANTIYARKAPGVGTFGSITVNVPDVSGAEREINFSAPTELGIKVEVSLTPLTGYTTNIGNAIRQAVVDYINALDVGEDLVVNRLYTPALLGGSADSETYKIGGITAALLPDTLGTADIPIAFTSKATALLVNVEIELL